MIQRTFDVKSEADLRRLADMKFFSEYTNAKTIFVQFYLSRFSAEDAQKVLDASRRELPQAKIIGMSLYGDPFVGLNTEKLMRFNFCFFDESEVTVLDYDGDKMAMNEIVADFQKNMAQIKDAKGVLLLGSGITFKASKFMDAVTEGHEDIPFFGSIANINTADIEDQAPYAFGNTMIRNGMVAAIFSGKNLHFYSESLFSWKPIGKEMLVEAGEPGIVGDSVIKTIDGLPATQIYKKYLDVEPDAHFVSNICEFPIVVNRNGYLMARVPCGFNEAGELNTMGDVRDGEYIRFTYGKASEILGKTEEASHRMRDFSPQAIFLYACANRAIFLKHCAHEEIDFYGRVVSELVYCHGFSELYRYKGQGGVFNSQLVTIGLREGEALYCNLHRPIIPGISFDNPRKHEVHSHAHRDFSADFEKHGKSTLGGGDALLHAGGGVDSMPHSVMSELEKLEQRETDLQEQQQVAWERAIALGELDAQAVSRHSDFERQIGVSIPITERLVTFLEATTTELREATRKANAANEAKSAFLSSMSHEIRSPINAVLGLDEMILRETNEDTIKSCARDIQSSGKSLLSIINDILDFSKIEAGKMEIIEDDYDLRSTITDLANMVEARALNKGLSFLVQVDETMPHLLHGDETRIKQCALNILTNAVKYTPSGSVTLTVGVEHNAVVEPVETTKNAKGEVSPSLQPPSAFSATPSAGTPRNAPSESVISSDELSFPRSTRESSDATDYRVKPDNDKPDTIRLKISVADTGIGIKEEDLEKLFKPFERIEENRNRSIEGTGLGMSIVNGLLSQMGTQLSVKSEYGKGSEFSFVLEQRVRDWEKIGTREESQRALLQEATAYTESFQAPEAKILVIDDTPVNLTVFKGLLKNTRIQIDTAESGAQALELVRKTEYHMLFVDHLMPKMDGLEFLAANFSDSTSINKNTPAIALTANAVSGAKEMYLSAGFDNYLSKPIDPKKLEEMIASYLPQELILRANDDGFVEQKKGEWDGTERRQSDSTESELFQTAFGVNLSDGLRFCGDKAIFMATVRDFREEIEQKANEIESYANQGDWHNFTILVHALKSSARLIGAGELSELAKELEEAGDKAQKNDENAVSTICEKTPALLALYRSYIARLLPLVSCEKMRGKLGSAESAEKPPLSKEKLLDAFSALKEVVSVFDFDTADSIIAELDGYAIPEELSEQYAKVRRAVRNADTNAVMEILN